MGLVEFHVDQVEVRPVSKLVLFGGRDTEDGETTSVSGGSKDGSRVPVTPAQVVAVALGATLLAFALARLKDLLDEKLALHC